MLISPLYTICIFKMQIVLSIWHLSLSKLRFTDNSRTPWIIRSCPRRTFWGLVALCAITCTCNTCICTQMTESCKARWPKRVILWSHWRQRKSNKSIHLECNIKDFTANLLSVKSCDQIIWNDRNKNDSKVGKMCTLFHTVNTPFIMIQ